MGLAVCADFLTEKVPNRLLFAGALTGLLLQGLMYGPEGVIQGVLQGICLFFLLWPLYRISGLVAGDCKLLMMCGVFFHRPYNLGIFMAAAFVSAAILGLFNMFLRGRSKGRRIHFTLPVLLGELYVVLYFLPAG